MTVYRAHTTRGRLEVQGSEGPVVFTTVPALYEMTNEEANSLRRKWGDRMVCEVMDDPPETSDDDQAITGPSPSGRVLPQESEPEATAEATTSNVRHGGAHLNEAVLKAILVELQGLTFDVVVGSAAATNIAIAAIKTEDTIIGAIRLNRDATAANIDLSSLLAEASVTSDANIQFSTTDTTGDAILVVWLNKNP